MTNQIALPQLISINLGKAAPLLMRKSGNADSVMSGIGKTAVSSLANQHPVSVHHLGIEGDEQVDLTVHGGLDKAVYVYPVEHYSFWVGARERAKLPAEIFHGKIGENLTVSAIVESQIWIGDELTINDVVLRVEAPRSPCFKFNIAMGFSHAAKLMSQSGFCGFYCSVVKTGTITAGSSITIKPGNRRQTVLEQFRASHNLKQDDLF